MKYLGVDYGKKKIGLAISEGLTASPYSVLAVTSLADAIFKIRHIIQKEEIDQLVIGLAESGQSANMTKAFIKEIRAEFPLEVVPETLSSQNAQASRHQLGLKSGDDDAYAAADILQNYLDSIK